MLLLHLSSFAPTGGMLSCTRNGRNMLGCALEEVWQFSFKIHSSLTPVLGDVQTTQKDHSKTIKTPITINMGALKFQPSSRQMDIRPRLWKEEGNHSMGKVV